MVKFGTDGIRGEFGKDLTGDIAYKLGNALHGNILVGQDTRSTGKELCSLLVLGAKTAGISSTCIGVCPTAGIAYLTKKFGFDYGVVITASHNPSEYNGIKLFSSMGEKLTAEEEHTIENHINNFNLKKTAKQGKVTYSANLINFYCEFLLKNALPINNLHIVLDCANGSTYKIAPHIFTTLGATVTTIHHKPNGKNINQNCGSQHVKNLQKAVLALKADMGFAFDGDGDRLIAISKNGKIIDGDMLLYILATNYKKQTTVVGTTMTNLGIEKALNKAGITLIRSDVGDKNVSCELEKNNLLLGAEQSGHIIIKDVLPTGDGILSALTIANTCSKQNKPLNAFFNFKLYDQTKINVKVSFAEAIMQNDNFKKFIQEQKALLANSGRIVVRKSGTEPVIRIMAESKCEQTNKKIANNIKRFIIKFNKIISF